VLKTTRKNYRLHTTILIFRKTPTKFRTFPASNRPIYHYVGPVGTLKKGK